MQPGASEHSEENGYTPTAPPDLVGKHDVDRMMREANWEAMSTQRHDDTLSAETIIIPDLSIASGGEAKKEEIVDAERNDALEGKRAGDAVFKAIFGDDSDDD